MSINDQQTEVLTTLYDKLQAKLEKLREQLSQAEKEFEAVSTTLRLMGISNPNLNSLSLEGMTQLEALNAIARANNNRLIVRTARRLMIRAGLFKNVGNSSSIIFTTINRSGQFIKEGPGTYRLKSQQEMVEQSPLLPHAVAS